jgi:hypothetical protein
MLAWGASERPPHTTQKTLFWLALAGWVLASMLALHVLKRRPRASALGLWSLQAVLALLAFALTVPPFELSEPGANVRVVPPLIVAGVAGELAGLLAIGLSRPRPPNAGEARQASRPIADRWRFWV